MGQTSKLPEPADDPLSVLEREFRALIVYMSRHRERVSGHGIERMALIVLGTLSHCGPARLTTVAERTGLDPSTLSRQVSDLEKAGLLSREPDPDDRRAALLNATAAGRDLMVRLAAGRRRRLQRLVEDWNEHDISEFGRLLAKINLANERHGDDNDRELEQELTRDPINPIKP